MKKLLPIATLALTGGVTLGLLSLAPTTSAADEFAKRDEDTPELVLVADDDDDDTNDADSNDDTSRESNDGTNSRSTGVSRDRDVSRGDLTKDFTRDGGDRTRDFSKNATNDRSRNDTRS